MNKLKILQGGMPLHLDDFGWIHSGISEAFKGVLNLFSEASNGYMILSGVEASLNGNTLSIQEGFILFDHEVCYVPQHDLTVTNAIGEVINIQLEVTYDAAGLDFFSDNVARNTYEIRRVVTTLLANNDPNQPSFYELPKLEDALRNVANEVVEVTPVLLNNWVVTNGDSPKIKKQNKRVFLQGKVTGGETETTIFTLPTGYRPSVNKIFLANGTFDPYFVEIKVYSNGEVKVENFVTTTQAGSTGRISLDGINFTIQ